MDSEILKAIGIVVGMIVVAIISYFQGNKKNATEPKGDNPIVTEARLLKFKAELDDEYAKKEEVNCISSELSAVMGKLDKFTDSFNLFKLEITNQIGAINTSIAVMAEAMKYIPKRKEDSNANN
jgi:hypothetical protein